MKQPYQVQVFGKSGCPKCDRLKARLDNILTGKKEQTFSYAYFDIESEDGILAFCSAECINPQRIPAMLVAEWDEATGEYEPVRNPHPGAADPVCGKSRLFQHLGLQTDYTSSGTITPKMIASVLDAVAA